jgi:hypothetical protein
VPLSFSWLNFSVHPFEEFRMKSLFLLAGATAMIAATSACAKQEDKAEPTSTAPSAATAQTTPAAQPAVSAPAMVAQSDTAKPAAAAAGGDAKPAAAAAGGDAKPAADGGGGDKPYKVVDGTKVDKFTMDGFRAWRAAACDRCHGPNQEGMVGASLINSLKVLSKADFKDWVLNGRPDKGMPAFSTNKQVVDKMDNLYAYLKGRSDGAITKAKVEEMQ